MKWLAGATELKRLAIYNYTCNFTLNDVNIKVVVKFVCFAFFLRKLDPRVIATEPFHK